MRNILVAGAVVVAVASVACRGGGASVPNPIGPVNTGGKPDPSKSTGTISTGGAANGGGAPDVNKSVPKKK